MLEVRNIRKYYEDQILLKDISFEVAGQETVCLLGPSGGGKSTLLRIIAGLEEKESGQILWNGEDISALPAHKRNFGLMFQDYALFPHMSVEENVAFGLRMQKMDAESIRARVEEVLDLVDMRAFLDRRVTDLSGGEQQRMWLWRARWCPGRRLLMLDEPLGRSGPRAARAAQPGSARCAGPAWIFRSSTLPMIRKKPLPSPTACWCCMMAGSSSPAAPQQVYNHPQSLWLANFFGQTNQYSRHCGELSESIEE